MRLRVRKQDGWRIQSRWLQGVGILLLGLIAASRVRAAETFHPGVQVAISAAGINVNVNGEVVIAINGNEVTGVAPALPPPVVVAPPSSKPLTEVAERSWFSWVTLSEILKVGAVFGGVGTVITFGVYTFYQNRNQQMVAKLWKMVVEMIQVVKGRFTAG